jgi:hypothetical protein
MNMDDVERRLTAYFAEAAGTEIDRDIFRGILPEDKCDAVGVFINSDDTGNTPSMQKYSAQILGRYLNRNDAMNTATLYCKLLPYYGADMVILRAGSAMTYRSRWDSRNAWGISINLQLTVRQ